MQQIFRPKFGKWLTIIFGTFCLMGLIGLVFSPEPGALLGVGPWLLLAAGICWALYWRPEVRVDDSGVTIFNVLRTVRVPWPAIQGINTRYALTLETAYGDVSAWAAPAPSRHAAMRTSKSELKSLPKSVPGTSFRPSDVPTTDSGAAATVVRRYWEELREAGHLTNPRLENDRLPVEWHVGTMITGVILLALALVSAFG